MLSKTQERIIPENFDSYEAYLLYLRHLFAYEFAKNVIDKNSFVLDIGTGEGYGTKLLSKNIKKIVGIDVDKNTIKHASNKYASENCTFKLYKGRRIPYKENTFDAIVSFQVIEHIKDDMNYLFEVRRVLKKDGIFIFTTPNRLYRLKPNQKPLNKFHIREYCPKSLNNLLERVFSKIEMKGVIGNKEINNIEHRRIRNQNLINKIPFFLRENTPHALKNHIFKIVIFFLNFNKSTKEKHFVNKHTVNDYNLTKESDMGLDLLVVCRK